VHTVMYGFLWTKGDLRFTIIFFPCCYVFHYIFHINVCRCMWLFGHCSLNWQHQLCKHPRSNPDIKTLFIDHTCSPTNGPLAPAPVSLPVAAVAKPAPYTSLGAHGVWYLKLFIFLTQNRLLILRCWSLKNSFHFFGV